jgi:hypothetical protein
VIVVIIVGVVASATALLNFDFGRGYGGPIPRSAYLYVIPDL